MSSLIVYMDHSNAKLFHLSAVGIQAEQVDRDGHENPNHEKSQKDFHLFFSELVGRMQKDDEVLIIGPGTAKNQFMHFLQEKFPLIVRKVVGVETADHLSDKQVLALARKNFRHAHLLSGT